MFEGLCIDLIDKAAKILDFEYEIYEVVDGKYGWFVDGTGDEWDGMVADLINKDADIALGALTMMHERETVVDFTIPYYYEKVGITVMTKKIRDPPNMFKFLACMQLSVWIIIVLAYAITSFIIQVYERFEPRNNSEVEGEDNRKRIFGIRESFWLGFTALTPQGGGETPRRFSGWMLTTGFWLFTFSCIATFTANLGAFLTVARIDSNIQNLDDLANQKKIK